MTGRLPILLAFALAIVIRMLGGYGNISPFSEFGHYSFFLDQKYPPSLFHNLWFFGAVVAWMSVILVIGSVVPKIPSPLGIVGRVPLFFYVVHLFVIHALAMAIVYAQVGSVPDWLWNFPPGHAGPGCGVDLPALYVIWFGVVSFHYPVCRWYGALKSRHPHSPLRFL